MDEKCDILPVNAQPKHKPSHKYRNPLILLICVIALAIYHLAPVQHFVKLYYPSSDIIAWQPCPDLSEYHCGYLNVPLDWSNPLPNEVASIALRKYPATAPRKERKGAILINPGGPGGSGHNAVVRLGKEISIVVQGKYDIIGFDPRLVNLTNPGLHCHPSALAEWKQTRAWRSLGSPIELHSGNYSVSNESSREYYHKVGLHQESHRMACKLNANEKVLRSASTAFVARDIKAIVEALGLKKISYWGFSYGTILGATLTAMFPDMVDRIVLDGTSDAVSYYNDMPAWGFSGMNSTNDVYRGLFAVCAAAGKQCPMYNSTMRGSPFTTESIATRFSELFASLSIQPMIVPGHGVLSASNLQEAIFTSLYAPKRWIDLYKAVAAAEQGDGSNLVQFVDSDPPTKQWDENIFHRHMGGESPLSTSAIMCGDTKPFLLDDEKLQSLSDQLANISVTGEIWTQWISMCSNWPFKPYEVYRGPFTVAGGMRKPRFPVLFVTTTFDPVTPRSAAESMAQGFGNESASLLIQNSYGHCSVASPSLCTGRAIRKYFLNGVLPAYGSWCEADNPIYPFEPQKDAVSILSAEDLELKEALNALSEKAEFLGRRPF